MSSGPSGTGDPRTGAAAGPLTLEGLFPGGVPAAARARGDDLLAAARAAVGGGRAVLPYYGGEGENGGSGVGARVGDLDVREKEPGDPVTAADHASNRRILEALRSSFPGDGIVSEESGATGPAPREARDGAREASPPPGARASHPTEGRPGGRLWIIDPLDGTSYFIDREPQFAVMVGLAEGGAAALGAVYVPARDTLYLGITELAAWAILDVTGRSRARRLSGGSEPAGSPLRFVESLAHPVPGIDRLEDRLGHVEVLLAGSVGIKCAMIAEGEADLYVHPVPYLGEWDTCAPEAVLRGAGGRVTDCAGEPLRYGKEVPRQPGGLFAARAEVWARVGPTVREVGTELLGQFRD